MPIVTGVFTPVSSSGSKRRPAGAKVDRPPPVAVITQLHAELAAAGFPVDKKETGATPKFGPATGIQLKSFQERYKLPATGNLDPTTGGVLSLSALVAEESDRAALRKKLTDAANALPDSPEYSYWIARYALLAGDPALAARVRPPVFDDLLGNDLGNGVFTDGTGNPVPQQPEVALPENFYSYRYGLMAQEDIDYLRTLEPPSTAPSSPRIALRPANGSPDTFDPPHQPVIYDPPTVAPPGATRQQRLIDSALMWLNAVEAWQLGNAEFARQRYASAVDAHNRCQSYILSYFSIYPDYDIQFTTATLEARVDELVWTLVSNSQAWADVWSDINWRRSLLSLAELSQFDWNQITPGNIVYELLKGNLAGSDQPPTGSGTSLIGPEFRKRLMDKHLVVIAAVLVPLARGEANRLRRQFSAALHDFSRVLRNSVPVPNAIGLQASALLRWS